MFKLSVLIMDSVIHRNICDSLLKWRNAWRSCSDLCSYCQDNRSSELSLIAYLQTLRIRNWGACFNFHIFSNFPIIFLNVVDITRMVACMSVHVCVTWRIFQILKPLVSRTLIGSSTWLAAFMRNVFILSSWFTFPPVWVLCLQEEKLHIAQVQSSYKPCQE